MNGMINRRLDYETIEPYFINRRLEGDDFVLIFFRDSF